MNWTCPHCDAEFEWPVIEESGPHLKALCPACSFYLKFLSKSEIPSIAQVRLLIWEEAQRDERMIASCKILCKFKIEETMTYNQVFVQYWNLLHTILIMIKRASQPSQISL